MGFRSVAGERLTSLSVSYWVSSSVKMRRNTDLFRSQPRTIGQVSHSSFPFFVFGWRSGHCSADGRVCTGVTGTTGATTLRDSSRRNLKLCTSTQVLGGQPVFFSFFFPFFTHETRIHFTRLKDLKPRSSLFCFQGPKRIPSFCP